jgi:hypothetical protein
MTPMHLPTVCQQSETGLARLFHSGVADQVGKVAFLPLAYSPKTAIDGSRKRNASFPPS